MTAYREYAIKAFELNAVDYLLKPLHDEQIEHAVKKAEQQIGRSKVSERILSPSSLLPHRSSSYQTVCKPGWGYIIMDNHKSVSISRDKKKEFFEVTQSN